jgi:hypothetical protein
MAKYWGYVLVPHNTYLAWKTSTNGNGYDVDSTYGCQCWDFVSLFWYNVGFPTGYPLISASSAYTMWTRRNENISYQGTTYFDLIYNVQDIKQGDIIVFNYFSGNPFGHVGFADVDYASWVPDPNQPYEFPILSENNQGTPDPAGGSYVNVHGYDIRLFLGAFRYKEWETTPPPPPRQRTIKKSRFPWVLYANKLRNKM